MKKTYRSVYKVFFPAFGILFTALFVLPAPLHAAEVSLAWDANTEPDLSGYKIHWGTASGSYGSSTDVGNVTSHTLTGLADGETYFFAATAYDSFSNESSNSNEVSTTLAPAAPAAPSASDSLYTDLVRVTWQDAAGETGYTVHRSTAIDGTYTVVGTTAAGVVTFDDPAACGGPVYYYKVSASNGGGSSTLSAADAGSTAECPPPPEFATVPDPPAGPASGYTGVSYSYSLSGGSSSYDDPVEYRIDWGDGSMSAWLPSGTLIASKGWDTPGTYSVRAKTRCADHHEVDSDWSAALAVTVTVDTEPPAAPGGLQFSAL
jgi:hypothetical protein